MDEIKTGRFPVSKRVRFEVFKRDSFKCQYCGNSAPEVVLHVDHIQPVAAGGDNDLTNLITACDSCNLGKSSILLKDATAVQKQHRQLEILQERREQLEMMMEWQRGLRSLAQDTVDALCTYWAELAPGWNINESGRANLQKWSRRFSIAEITHAMGEAADCYLKRKPDGNVTSDSWELAFSKIPGICRVEQASKEEPDLRELYYIRGILRNKCTHYFDDAKALELLKVARSWEVPIERLRSIAKSSTSWSKFQCLLDTAISEQKYAESSE